MESRDEIATVGSRKNWSWQENVEFTAQRLSKKIEEAFKFEMDKGQAFLPFRHQILTEPTEEEIQDQMRRQLEIFIDYSVGTLAAILTTYASRGEDFEEILVSILRDKFKRLREMSA